MSDVKTAPLSSLELMREIHHRVPEVEIRDEHLDALDALAASEQPDADGRALIVMASGLGKTTVMAAHARRRLLVDPTRRALFLNDSNYILGQARERFESVVGEEFSYGQFNGDGRDYGELSVLFGSFQVMRNWHPAFKRDEFDFGMVDESHHGAAPTYKPTIDYFDFKHLSGFTATPDRMDVLDIRDIFGKERYTLPIEDALAKRLLTPVDYYVITDEIVEQGFAHDSDGVEHSFDELDRLVFAPRRDEEIVKITEEYAEQLPYVKRIVFCRSIEHAERFARYYPNGLTFHSGLPEGERKDNLTQFRHGDVDTLVVVDAANEGIDDPPINQVVMLRETASKRIFNQQLGRGLRKYPGKTKVQALDFVANCEHLLMVDRLWQDVAKSAGQEPVEDAELMEIDLNRIHFNEATRRILPMLREISSHVYRPEQAIEAGSVRISTLARELDATPASIKAMARVLKITPNVFPTYTGGGILYVSAQDAARIEAAKINLFG